MLAEAIWRRTRRKISSEFRRQYLRTAKVDKVYCSFGTDAFVVRAISKDPEFSPGFRVNNLKKHRSKGPE